MANIKISNLPVAISVAGSDSFPVVQSGVTKQATKSVLLTDLGTPASLVLTNATGLPIDAGTINTLPVARGGTGVTTSTGSGNVVLSASPTLTGTTIVSALTASGNVSFNGGTFAVGTITPASGASLDVNGSIRAKQGAPDAADTSTTGYAFGGDGDTGMFSPVVGGGTSNGVLAFYCNDTERLRITATNASLISTIDGTAPSLSTNSTMSFELTSNTSLKVVVRGTDGVTRSVSLTLS